MPIFLFQKLPIRHLTKTPTKIPQEAKLRLVLSLLVPHQPVGGRTGAQYSHLHFQQEEINVTG